MNSNTEKYMEKNKNVNRGYRKLDVWKEGIEFYSFIKKKIKTVNELSFKTKAQIEDSALSVPSNIAEGYCRRYLRENIQYNTIALASLGENYTQMFALLDSGEINEEWFDEYDSLHYSLENKLIKLNKASIENLRNSYDWKNDYQVKEIVEKYSNI
jgi:four helix bundle protein